MPERGATMTESEWLSGTALRPMLEALNLLRTPMRKGGLFSCACCRRVWQLLTDGRSKRLIQVRELHAIRVASEEDLEQAVEAVNRARRQTSMAALEQDYDYDSPEAAPEWAERASFFDHPGIVADLVQRAVGCLEPLRRDARRAEEEAAQCDLLRDIFGNPFRPVVFDPKWRTPTTELLARGIYLDRAFDRMPILADALEEAGCDDRNVLDHCRGGTHVRGCWVVDLVMGYE